MPLRYLVYGRVGEVYAAAKMRSPRTA